MRNTVLMIAGLWMTLTISCVSEGYFGYSSIGAIKTIEVSNQAGVATILNDSSIAYIPFPPGVDISEIRLQVLTLSSFATADIQQGAILDFTVEQIVNVTAEDGTITQWRLIGEIAGANPQLPNSDFELWYETPSGYREPGESATNTIWGTGNPGTQLIDILTVTPYELADQGTATKMETKFNGTLPAAFGTPISAGSIFIGVFNTDNIDPNNPRAAIDFGSPFTGRPDAFRISYTYSPGVENQDRDQVPLPYPDNCDIYVLLEVRKQDNVRRLATGWFRSPDEQLEYETIEVPMVYGPLDDSYPDYMKPVDDSFIPMDSASFILPTHITFVASSSFDGDNFAGAIGSLLFIDDLQLIYN